MPSRSSRPGPVQGLLAVAGFLLGFGSVLWWRQRQDDARLRHMTPISTAPATNAAPDIHPTNGGSAA